MENNMTDMLTIDQIMNADDLHSKVIDVPEWGGKIRIQQITKAKQAEIRKASIVDDVVIDELLECGIVAAAIIEPAMSMEHVNMLQQKNADVVDRIMGEVFLLNAMDKEAIARSREEFPAEPGEVDDVQPGGEAGNDGEAAPAGDVDD